MTLNFILNSRPTELEVSPDKRLLDLLREDLGLTGTKEGCGEGECGACTVIIDGEAMHSCLVLACQLEGKSVLTIEGLEQNGELDKIQKIFIEETAIQCGFCTTGMIMSTKALLMHNPHPTETEIRNAPRRQHLPLLGLHPDPARSKENFRGGVTIYDEILCTQDHGRAACQPGCPHP